VEEASRTTRVRCVQCAWGKFNELERILTKRGAFLQFIVAIYMACLYKSLPITCWVVILCNVFIFSSTFYCSHCI